MQVLQLETHEALQQLRAGRADIAVVHHMPGIAVPETAGLRRRTLLVETCMTGLRDAAAVLAADARIDAAHELPQEAVER